jgi:N-carbamoylsarcosine amidase
MTAKLQEALEAAFAEAPRIYGARGFQRRIGFGRKPALVNVDLANAWTRPGKWPSNVA